MEGEVPDSETGEQQPEDSLAAMKKSRDHWREKAKQREAEQRECDAGPEVRVTKKAGHAGRRGRGTRTRAVERVRE